MKIRLMMASVTALAACGGGGDEANTTVAMDNSAMATGDNMAMENMAGGAEMARNGQEYATMAAASDMYEIESSRIAVQKSQNAEVKAFAQMLITDHEKATADLKTAAQSAQPAITVTPALNAEQTMNIEALQAAGARDFDRIYLQQQVPAHEEAFAMVQGYAQSGDVPALKAHASTISGPIQQHLDKAKQLSQQSGQ